MKEAKDRYTKNMKVKDQIQIFSALLKIHENWKVRQVGRKEEKEERGREG